MVVSYVKPETHKGLKRVTRVQCSWIFTFTIFGNLSDGFPFINKMAAARSPCRCFKTRVLHFKVKNTPVKDKKWKEKVLKECSAFFLWRKGSFSSRNQGHSTTVFWKISVRSPLEWLKFSRAQEQLKISKMFRGDCLLGSEFRDLCGVFT